MQGLDANVNFSYMILLHVDLNIRLHFSITSGSGACFIQRNQALLCIVIYICVWLTVKDCVVIMSHDMSTATVLFCIPTIRKDCFSLMSHNSQTIAMNMAVRKHKMF